MQDLSSSLDRCNGVASLWDDLDICSKFFSYLSIVSASGNWTIIPQLCNAVVVGLVLDLNN